MQANSPDESGHKNGGSNFETHGYGPRVVGVGVLSPARKVPSSVDRLFRFDPVINPVIITYQRDPAFFFG
jgi:hypothetical protein